MTVPRWLQPFQKYPPQEAEALWSPKIELKRYGGVVTVSDEAIRLQRFLLFERELARIGRQVGIDSQDLALDILLARTDR